MSFLANIFGGSGIVKSLEKVALESIETKKESAEAKALLLKTIDPNSKMRRDLSTAVTKLYVGYMCLITVLILMSCFEIGNADNVSSAIMEVTDLFMPLTTMFSLIIGASFGVNGINSFRSAKQGVAENKGK